GDTDIGNHCDDCTTFITLPFPIKLYGTFGYTGAYVSSNGNLQLTGNSDFFSISCFLPDFSVDAAILPYYGDLVTSPYQFQDCSVFRVDAAFSLRSPGLRPT